MNHRAWVEIDLGNLVDNARAVQAAAGGAPLLPMVKANAYGVGAVPVARALEALEPWGFGVATIDEGAALRAAGIARPLLVFTPPAASDVEQYRAHALTAVLDDPATAAAWPLPYHVEIDTGMARCGVRWSETPRVRACWTERLEGAFTHLYAADRADGPTDEQVRRFRTALDAFPERPRWVHVANSAGAWRLAERFDLVRPGIFLYGGRAGAGLPDPAPVVALRASVVSLRDLEPGDPVSYGSDWTAPEPTRVATVAAGYADGVLRSVQGRASVLIRGVRYPVVGRITMDFIMVGVGRESEVRVGDVATLIGRDGGEQITIDDMAMWAGTISYEVLARLGERLERRYRA